MRHSFVPLGFAIALIVVCAAPASAQSDEIQVYDGGLAPKGVFNLTLHNNFTPKGIKDPGFPGAIVSDKSLNGVPEWAYGVPNGSRPACTCRSIASTKTTTAGTIDGFKLRALFAVPHADDRKFFYGANFEFSINSKQWDRNATPPRFGRSSAGT